MQRDGSKADQLKAFEQIHSEMKEHVTYWRVKQSVRDHLINAKPNSVQVQSAVKNFLATSGNAKRLDDLLYGLKERLYLPYTGCISTVPEAKWRLAAGVPRVPQRGSPATSDGACCPQAPQQLYVQKAAPPRSDYNTPFQRWDAGKDGRQHSDWPALTESGVDAIKSLRNEWQRLVVERLMHVKSACGMPLARRARTGEELGQLRRSQAKLASIRITHTGPSARISLLPGPVVTNELLLNAIEAAASGRSLADVMGDEMADIASNQVALATSSAQHCARHEPGVASAALRACVPPWEWLRDCFEDLHPRHRHSGLDDMRHDWFRDHVQERVQTTLRGGGIEDARKLLRQGAPVSTRAALWHQALALSPKDKRHGEHLEALCGCVESRELLVDLLIDLEINKLSNSDEFFLFVAPIRTVALALSRDSSAMATASATCHPRLVGLGEGGARRGAYPPGGCLPSEGAIALIAPLAYLHDNVVPMFVAARALHCRFWCKLQCFSAQASRSPCFPVLGAVLLVLLDDIEPSLSSHLHSIGCSPLAIAVPWMLSAFVGYLDIQEVLQLWDRIIGFDSLLLLPVLSVACLAWRSKKLKEAENKEEALAVVQDLSRLQVVPLLQAVLFLSPFKVRTSA